MAREKGAKAIATNRRARHHYAVLDTVEAGVVLVGTEVKSLRLGRASLVDAFATVDDGEVWLRGLHIGEYVMGTWTNHAPLRVRKLLLHRREIDKFGQRVHEGGLSLVPLSMYFTDGRVKVELGLVRGKKTWDKRNDLATRDANREIERAFSRHVKGRTRQRGR
ncbi:MAG: SsrA-binding protein SmpB [Actinomycetota bacterium]|nr:SsrA-binding protein SmpB [Actinomycetota bacterium]